MEPPRVWIVLDESDDATQPLLGVFTEPSKALDLMDRLAPDYADGALAMGGYEIGWSILDDRSSRYREGPLPTDQP